MSRSSWRDRTLESSPPSRSMATFSSTRRSCVASSTRSRPPLVLTSRSTPSSSESPAPNGQRAEDEGQGREEVSGPFRAFLVVRNGLDLAVEAAGVPAGGLRAYLGTLEEHDAGPRSSEVVGGGTTGDAPTDHCDVEL